MSDEAGSLPAYVPRILDRLPQALLLLDLDGRILHANPSCEALTGATASQLVEERLHDLVAAAEEDVEGLLERWAGSGQPRPGVLRMAATGTELHAEGSRIGGIDVLLVRCRGRDVALGGFDELAREVETNNLRRMKRQLEETIEDLRGANRRLEDANAELNSYAAVVSHDLRTPLTTIAGFVELLELDHADELGAEGQRIIQILKRNTHRLGQVIDALLELARTKGPPEHVAPLEPREVVGEVLEQIGGDVDAEVVIEDLPTVAVDRTHLSQVFQNLLTNSLRYRSPERPLRITIDGADRNGVAELTVSDNGLGVAPEDRERIFEPLQRGRDVHDNDGTGIGLATCHKIVRSYGGDIWVVEREGPGTTIAFTLPSE